MSESKHTTDEFTGNVKVTISENEVRVWVCDEEGCQFRFKTMGKVLKSGGMDVMVVAKNNSHDKLLEACKRLLGAMCCDELNNGQIFNDDLRKEVKGFGEQAIVEAEKGLFSH